MKKITHKAHYNSSSRRLNDNDTRSKRYTWILWIQEGVMAVSTGG